MISTLPRPKGYKILIERTKPKEKTDSGILLPDSVKDVESYMDITAKVVAMGDMCYHNRDTGEPWKGGRWCAVGDWVIVPKFTQFQMAIDDVEYRFINDDEIIAVIDDPSVIKVYS